MQQDEYAYSFKEGCNQVRRGIGRRNLEPAYNLAKWLERRYPDHADTYNVLNLVVCLIDRDGGGRCSQRLIDKARECTDYTDLLGGDMQRDRVIGLTRYARDNDDLVLAEQLIDEAERLHDGDPNRLACLKDVRGRLAYARGAHTDAVALHSEAHRLWDGMYTGADQNWVYNNLVHWLKAVVAEQGAWSRQAGRLSALIRVQRPEGAPNRHREARVIRTPLIGNRIHDALTRRR